MVLELDLEGVPTDDDVSPAEEHFLVAQRGEVFRHLISVGAYTNGLGESGELLAAVDLDGDGTDELILEWRYSEGRWYRLVQRRGDSLVLLGEFGIGT